MGPRKVGGEQRHEFMRALGGVADVRVAPPVLALALAQGLKPVSTQAASVRNAASVERTDFERARHQWVHPASIAGVYAVLGDPSRALDWLEEAERRGALAPELNAVPEFRGLHGAPRYQRLLRALGLP